MLGPPSIPKIVNIYDFYLSWQVGEEKDRVVEASFTNLQVGQQRLCRPC